ncbi:MAG: VCBS repeat-containing protein [Deltaproteobacteria bacterium]|nr:VCBS repeat-containing protein [Deltaproteobacteria bacterium]
MSLRALLLASLLLGLLPALGCSQPADEQVGADAGQTPDAAAGPTLLRGAVQKGPFVLGSSVSVSPVSDLGSPVGQVFQTQTDDDLGRFTVELPAPGLVLLEASGFYYNEVTGKLSAAALTLRAFARINGGGPQDACINVITHLTYGRIKALLQAGTSIDAAVVQAEGELVSAMGVGAASTAPTARGVAMNVLGGDEVNNAYLLCVSAVLVQAAIDRAGATGSVEANLQELLNIIATDLSDDGILQPPMRISLQDAQTRVIPEAVMELLAARLTLLGSSAVVPEMNRVLDEDGDGVPNAQDTCRRLPNADQQPMPDALCSLRRLDVALTSDGAGPARLTPETCTLIADFDGDGKADILVPWQHSFLEPAAPSGRILKGDGSGRFEQRPTYVSGECGQAMDVDGDGDNDVITLDWVQIGASYTTGAVLWRNPGDGSFQQSVPMVPQAGPVLAARSPSYVGDLDGDGRVDLFASSANVVAWGNSTGTWSDWTEIASLGGLDSSWGSLVGDANGDGWVDIIGMAERAAPKVALGRAGRQWEWGAPSHWPAQLSRLVGLFDVNRDGHLDLVVLQYSDDGNSSLGLAVSQGDGEGGFAAPTLAVPIDEALLDLRAIGDLVGGSFLDVAYAKVVSPAPPTNLTVLVGNSATGFAAPVELPDSAGTRATWGGDLNGDGSTDLASVRLDASTSTYSFIIHLLNP